MKLHLSKGFTLIELVMVILLIGILAAVAIPNFIDFRTDAKNATTKGALGAMRGAVAIARAAIQLKEDPQENTPAYPTAEEMQVNAFDGSHPALSATPIMDISGGVPQNPWTITTIPGSQWNSVIDCSALARSLLVSAAGLENIGWCYNATTGQVWANSARNSGSVGNTENAF